MSISFSNIETGHKFPPVVQSYAQSAIDHYALASLDMNPVHTNEEWAARAKVFGIPETVGHGMMTMSTLASVVTRAWGVIGKDGGSIRFVDAKLPVKGEKVTATGSQTKAPLRPRKKLGSNCRRGKGFYRRPDGLPSGYNLPD
jgi:acyl dehydratase